MPDIREVTPGRSIIGRLAHGKDLLEELSVAATEQDIRLGRVEAIGALQRARLGFYDQGTKQYQFHDFPMPLEIVSLVGNVSLKDGKPIIHAHLALSDDQGRGFGGHLAPGCVVFACEFIMQELTGATLERGLDEPTKLPLWPM